MRSKGDGTLIDQALGANAPGGQIMTPCAAYTQLSTSSYAALIPNASIYFGAVVLGTGTGGTYAAYDGTSAAGTALVPNTTVAALGAIGGTFIPTVGGVRLGTGLFVVSTATTSAATLNIYYA